ncbi:MAG: ABC transporter substrate-binding protein [Chloroflexota bacterium]
MKSKRLYYLLSGLTLLSMLALTLAGCGTPEPTATPAPKATATRPPTVAPSMDTPVPTNTPEAQAEEVVKGGHVTIAMWSPPNNFNAVNTDSSYGFFNVNLMFETLVKLNDDVEFVGRLADSWDVSDDQTQLTFHLNPNAKWHDGTPVTAADVEFTLWVISHPEIEVNRGANIAMLKGLEGSKRPEGVDTVEGVKVIDEHTIQFTANNPVDPLFFLELVGTGVWIIPKHILQDVPPADFDKADFWMNPTVGAGPFKFVKYETDQFIEYARNEDYHLGAPYLDSLIVKIITPATMVAQLEKGEVDITSAGGIGDVPLDDWERVQGLENVNAYGYQDNGYQYMIINWDPNGPWTDKRARQALAYALNRQLIVDKLLKGEGVIAQTPIIPVTYYYNPEVEGQFAYDPAKAKALLEEAGFDFEQEITLLVPIGNIVRELSADIIQANLQDVGLKVSIEKMDFPTMMARFKAAEFDIGLVGWSDVLDPDVRSQFHSTGQYNFGAINSPVLDDLLDRGANTADPEDRKVIYDEFQLKFLDEMPVVCLYWPLRLAAINNRVQNARHIITTNGLLRNVHEWWVTDGK